MTTKPQTLREILVMLDAYYIDSVPMRYSLNPQQAESAIKELVRSKVPEASNSTCVCDRDGCWNDCRKQTLENLESL